MKRILAVILAAMLMFTFAACREIKGDSGAASAVDSKSSTEATSSALNDTLTKDDTSSDSNDVSENDTDLTDDKSADDTASFIDDDPSQKDSSSSGSNSSKKYATMQAYIDDPVNSKGLDEIKKAGEGVMDIDIKADGSTLVYDYAYKTTMPESTLSDVKTSLDSIIDASESTFVRLAQQMQAEIAEDIQIRVIYRNSDGTIITERTFEP